MKYLLQIPAATLAAILCGTLGATAAPTRLASPSGDISVTVSEGSDGFPVISVDAGGRHLVDAAAGLTIEGKMPGHKLGKATKPCRVTEEIKAPFHHTPTYTDVYNTVTLPLGDGLALELRAYDNGVAYRFKADRKAGFTVAAETADFDVPDDTRLWLSHSTNPKKPLAMAFQNFYTVTPADSASSLPAFLPACVDYGDGLKMTLLESDLEAYPGMFVSADSVRGALKGVFAQYPKATDYYPWRHQLYVTETEPYIARSPKKRDFPWRIMAITTDDRQMPSSNLVYSLASPSRVADTSWIEPGKVAWEWWNDWGLRGVDFKAGINNATYKKYIDFAADNGLEYVVLDEGWYVPSGGDMLTTVPEIDLPELISYGKERNVGIVLWTVFNVLDDQLEEACRKYSDMGVKGFKVDFLDRDDQQAVEMAYRIADAAARHNLLLDYHGFYKPTGLNRTYPNIINFEAVFGMEEMKWSDPGKIDMPRYDVTFPYLRGMCGPVDYTPGAMRNASKADWKPIYYNPMSQGTRAHQGATYVVFDSPFTMLCDSPSLYEKNRDWVDYIVPIPETFDSSEILDGVMGRYIVSKRVKDGNIYIAGLTDWEGRDYLLDFSFLPEGSRWQGTLMRDGVNADKEADDYVIESVTVSPTAKLPVRMASGGGFVLTLSPEAR